MYSDIRRLLLNDPGNDFLSHQGLLELAQALGYPFDDGGLCDGFSMSLAQTAAKYGNEQRFFDILALRALFSQA